jgi:hypothetical protein
MQGNTIVTAVAAACAAVLLAACSDRPTSPAVVRDANVASATLPHTAQFAAASLTAPLPEAFTARASIAPYFINQMPDLMLRSMVTADLVIQRLVTPLGGGGGWHTHPGPSFAIVERGRVMITRYSEKTGCTSTVYGPGEAAGNTYYEVAGEVHIAKVVGSDDAVESKVRFNIPQSAVSFGNPAAAPPC